MIDRLLKVFFNHFGYFEYKYGLVVSSGCPVLLRGYLEGRLGPLPMNVNSLLNSQQREIFVRPLSIPFYS